MCIETPQGTPGLPASNFHINLKIGMTSNDIYVFIVGSILKDYDILGDEYWNTSSVVSILIGYSNIANKICCFNITIKFSAFTKIIRIDWLYSILFPREQREKDGHVIFPVSRSAKRKMKVW